jgi:F-type H+-transporting ATPase subunit delta
MKITVSQLATAYYRAAKDVSEKEVTTLTKNFVLLLRTRKMLSKKAEILSEVEAIRDREEKHITAYITSAKKLSEEEEKSLKANLKKSYKAEAVTLEQEIDSSRIGGADVQVGWEKINNSIKHRLETLKQTL